MKTDFVNRGKENETDLKTRHFFFTYGNLSYWYAAFYGAWQLTMRQSLLPYAILLP